MALGGYFLHLKFQVVLWSASGIYFFAFFSLYHQLPGLYSDNGLLPVHSALQISSKISPFSQFKEQKNLLVFTKYLEITIYDGMELLCIFGTVLSTLMMITKKLRNTVSFILLYICYLSCYKEIFQDNHFAIMSISSNRKNVKKSSEVGWADFPMVSMGHHVIGIWHHLYYNEPCF